MFFDKSSKEAKKEIEKVLEDIQMNLENNYKDLAIGAFKKAVPLVEDKYKQGLINEKVYIKYCDKLKNFEKRMEGYSHRLNIKF